jgi:tetratricopeptide (TPR) repeat protein
MARLGNLNATGDAGSFHSPGGTVAQVFLSYSRQDAEVAKALAGGLRSVGHQVWWDKNISGGSAFAAEIEQALSAADVVIVLWSEAAVKSPWVLDEAAEGRDTGRLLPIALDDCRPPLGFRQYQTIAVASTRPDEALERIMAAVARKSGGDPDSGAARRLPAMPPNSIQALCAKARQLAQQGRYDEAQRQVDAALAMDANSWEANREAARLLYTQGFADRAIPFGEKALAARKTDHQSASLLISCYRATHNKDALKEAAEQAVARAEQSIASGSGIGSAFASGAKGLAVLGHEDRARKWLRKALNVDPGNLPLRYDVAAVLAAFVNDGDAALDVLEAVVEAASSREDLQLLETDPDWNSIRQGRTFQSLVHRARKRVEALEATGFAAERTNA